MKSIALTGSKFSGKSTVAKEFKKLGIPVFDGDLAIKFLLNYVNSTKDKVIKKFGNNSYFGYRVNSSILDKTSDVYELLSCTELKIFDLYFNWRKKMFLDIEIPKYVIFMSSVIYEQKLKHNFDKVISVYCPLEDRLDRINNNDYQDAFKLNNEYNPILKNEKSDYVIHNYDNHDITKQVLNVHNQIIGKKELVI